jgi:AcrR family transcriptional regulator
MAHLPKALSPLPEARRSPSREEISAHQRDRVAEAAIETFAKRGYLATTVDQIVAAANVGVGTFYELFDGKEACFFRAYDLIVAEARAEVAGAVRQGEDWPAKVRRGLRGLVGFLVANPFRARLVLVEIQTGGPRALDRYEDALDAAVPFLRLGRELSPIADELPESLEIAVIGGLAWFLQQRVVMGELARAERMLPELLGLTIEPYLGEAAAREYIAALDG